MMTHQAGVRIIAAGGRPTTGPMQGASGSRGAAVYSADFLDSDFTFVASLNNTAAALLPQNRNDTGMFIIYAGFNLRDQVRLGDPVPLQFKYEAADCRIYYTLANVYNMSRLWRDAAHAAWDDQSLCVADSTGYPTALNTSSPGFPKPPPPLSPSLNLPSSSHVDFALNSTGGLPDAREGATRDITISLCGSGGTCSNGGQCQPVSVQCQSGSRLNTNACLPACRTTTSSGRGSCTGANTFCDPRSVQEAKVNSVKGKDVKFGATVYSGFCTPTSGTADLGCPA
jgi:hypothetical protein